MLNAIDHCTVYGLSFHFSINLHCLFSFLQVQALVATVHEILDFQVKFLKEIERPVESETGFEEFNAIEQFQVFSWYCCV